MMESIGREVGPILVEVIVLARAGEKRDLSSRISSDLSLQSRVALPIRGASIEHFKFITNR
jgi:hypothetical protein